MKYLILLVDTFQKCWLRRYLLPYIMDIFSIDYGIYPHYTFNHRRSSISTEKFLNDFKNKKQTVNDLLMHLEEK